MQGRADLKMEQVMHKQKTDIGNGPIAWMAKNHVVANLLMLVLLIGGLFMLSKIKREVFPEFDLDMVTISVAYPGSSPEEVEQGIVLVVEEAIRGLDGVKEVRATASEGNGIVIAELLEGVNGQKVYQDIKQEIDRITTFPEEAEEPNVRLEVAKRQVIDIQIFGDASEWVLRDVAESVRDSLLQSDGITQVELGGVRDYEISAEIDRDVLREYGLTLQEVASVIRTSAVEIPCGLLQTDSGDILVRIKQRCDWADEFAQIPIIVRNDGTVVYLGDIAKVIDGFEDSKSEAYFNGKRAIGIDVYRIGKQTPTGVSDSTKAAMKRIEASIPDGIDWVINNDRSDMYRQRLSLLLKNAAMGLVLVLLILSMFLEIRLAFWVTVGIPVSFLGAFLLLPVADITINMISMFAFIIALGIVVDDAIVVGENIYEHRKRGDDFLKSAYLGAKEVAGPVCYSIITNIVAFVPLLFVPGIMGKVWKVTPIVVSTVFTISLIESVFILPAHLSRKHKREGKVIAFVHKHQQSFSGKYEAFIRNRYAPFLDYILKYRYLVISISIMLLAGIFGFVKSGRIGIIQMPRVESDYAYVSASLPYGSPISEVRNIAKMLVKAGENVAAENGGDKLSKGLYTVINENQVSVRLYLTDAGIRPISTAEVTNLWREKVGQIPGLEILRFESDRGGPGSGAALEVELSHRDIDVLDRAGTKLAELLEGFSVVKDVDDGYQPGKRQYNFRLKPEGRALGLTARDIATQVRGAFYGAEAFRQQRGRNEVRVRVKYPIARGVSEYDIERFLVRTPAGTDVPLLEVADYDIGRAYTSISRKDGRRVIRVSANVEPISETSKIEKDLETTIFPQIKADFPGLSCGWEGKQKNFVESTSALYTGFIFALLGIYAVLAVPFKSYWQPIIVMMAIPFGIIGAVLGHIMMGYSISIISMMGIVALSGVVVNDSLVLIEYANKVRTGGKNAMEAIHVAGVRRFRPIMLTTLTTFGGLAPMIFETSRQARFMIPMAISLGFGILFATCITLVIVPCLYVMLEDIANISKKVESYVYDEV